ncbi:MAG: efflux RND transporter periplasmic adaptor subunit [Candidatus Krumholzibacteriales bacterium]
MKTGRLIIVAVLSAAVSLLFISCGDDHGHSHDEGTDGHQLEEPVDDHGHSHDEVTDGHQHEEPVDDHGHSHDEGTDGHQHEEPVDDHGHTHEEAAGEINHGHTHDHAADLPSDAGGDAAHDHGSSDGPAGAYNNHTHENESPGTVHLNQGEIDRFGIDTEPAGHGVIRLARELQGKLAVNEDRTVHVVPRVSGIVREVSSRLGDRVRKGEVLAVIESAELADLKASYLAAAERYDIAGAAYQREKRLRDDGISSESEYLEAKKAFTEAKIERRSSRQKLLALGFDEEYLQRLRRETASIFTEFAVRAPFSGTIIRKHITAGESVRSDTDIFTITDMDTVWADLQVFQSDAEFLEPGQELEIWSDHGTGPVRGRISVFNPVIDRDSRTSLARVVLENSSGRLRPGTFITARIAVGSHPADLVLKRDAIQEIGGAHCVFVRSADGFEARRVELGRTNSEYAEVAGGLEPGELVAVRNSFMLKAELKKSEKGAHDGHGHSH